MTRTCADLWRWLHFLLLLVSGVSALNKSEKGFLLTGPKRVLRGTEERFCLHLQGVQSAGHVTLALQANMLVQVSPVRQRIDPRKDDYEDCISLTLSIPSYVHGGETQLHLKVDWDDPQTGLIIDSTKAIEVSGGNRLLQLIQTDKAWYTPGELVRFRTLTLNHLLQPVVSTLNRVWIVDPRMIIMNEWKNVTSDLGLAQFEWPLSWQPVEGVWEINVDNGDSIEKQKFQVKEVVLPRFEVTITAPDFVSPQAETLNFSICAKCPPGQPVQGEFEAVVQLKRLTSVWFRLMITDGKPTKFTGRIDKFTGCQSLTFPVSELGIDGKTLSQHVNITGQITEKDTGIKRSATVKVAVQTETKPFVVLDISSKSPSTFKLGLPIIGEGNVRTYPGDKTVPFARVRLCSQEGYKNDDSEALERIRYSGAWKCTNVTADANGNFAYSLLPSNRDVVAYNFQAEYGSQITTTTQKASYSPSESFAVIASKLNQPLACNKRYTFEVYLNNVESGRKLRLHYFVTGRGDLLSHGVNKSAQVKTVAVDLPGSLDNTKSSLQVRTLDLEITVLPSFYPKATLMVYYVREDGEVVTAQTELKVAPCFSNSVSLQWDAETTYPGAVANLKIHSAPGSLCGLNVVDKSVMLTKSDWQLKEDALLEKLGTFHISSHDFPNQSTPDDIHCQRVRKREINERRNSTDSATVTNSNIVIPPLEKIPVYYSLHEDAVEAFGRAGLLVMSSWEMESRPCNIYYEELRSLYDSEGNENFSNVGLTSIPTTPVITLARSYNSEVKASKSPQVPINYPRVYFPETWLWGLYTTDSNGDILIKEVPRTKTSWAGRALCVSHSTGFGMSQEVSIEAFQPFSLELHVPYSIKRGETLTLKVSVHNYVASDLSVNVLIESSDAFELVSPSSMTNIIEPRGTQIVDFRIRPTTLGRLNLTIHGQVNVNSDQLGSTEELPHGKDKLVKSILVEADGLPTEDTQTRFVCPQEFDDDKNKSGELQSLYEYINGASVSVVGDIMGSILDAMDTYLEIPVGCGENNMLPFTTLISVAEYLESSKQLDEKLRKKIMLQLQKGYQMELNCRHKDGSFSTFGPRDEGGSVWYTAFVAKSFAKARKFIFVDNQVMDESIRWIVNHQFEDGCFNASGAMLDKDFNQMLLKQGEEEHRMQRTAFALVSLIESGWKIDDGVIANATMCIKRQQRTSLYTQALTAYALSLWKDKDALEHFEKILTQGSTDKSIMWWELRDSLDVASEFDYSSLLDVASEFDNSSTYTDEYRNPFSVETTSYALLALLQFQRESDMGTARHIVRWLTTQRNSFWCFTTTEDTPIGIQALAAYATALGVTDVDLNVKIVAENVNETIKVRKEDRLAEKRVQLPIIPTKVQMEVEGSGCAVVRTTLLGSLQHTFQNMGFVLNITSEPIGKESACVAHRLKVCAKYLLGGSSGMTVMEIDMFSGYGVEKQEMQKLLRENPNIKRAEKMLNKIALYFDSVDENGICASFVVWPAFEVQDAVPAYVKIVDYYEHTRWAVETYLLPPSCGLAASSFGGIDG